MGKQEKDEQCGNSLMDTVLGHQPASQAPVVINTSLGTRDDDSRDDTGDSLCLSPVIEESQEPDDEDAAQEELLMLVSLLLNILSNPVAAILHSKLKNHPKIRFR